MRLIDHVRHMRFLAQCKEFALRNGVGLTATLIPPESTGFYLVRGVVRPPTYSSIPGAVGPPTLTPTCDASRYIGYQPKRELRLVVGRLLFHISYRRVSSHILLPWRMFIFLTKAKRISRNTSPLFQTATLVPPEDPVGWAKAPAGSLLPVLRPNRTLV